jgi:hypothetical protein
MPVSLFDPAYFCPKAENSLISLYRNLFTGPCDCVVDPSIDTVQRLLAEHCGTSIQMRVVLHYFGYGCHSPTSDGNIYFFTENRGRYFAWPITTYLQSCHSPLLLIFDCSNSGALYKHVLTIKNTKKLDLIAFFSCAGDQIHPMSTDLPLDLFSRCLLQPFQMALWWHRRKYAHLLEQDFTHLESDRSLQGLFLGLIDAIAIDSVSDDSHDILFRKDPTVAAISRGFLLAQRIFSTFHLTGLSVPQIEPPDRHSLWEFWEIAVDLALSNRVNVNNAIFEMLMKSFRSSPFSGAFPVFAYFMGIPEFHGRVVHELLEIVEDAALAKSVYNSQIWKAIIDAKRVSANAMLLLAKLIVGSEITPFETHMPVALSGTADAELLRAGMLALTCSLSKPSMNSYHRLSMVCVQAPDSCAPLSFLLFGLLEERVRKFMALPISLERFMAGLNAEHADVRAAAAFALGCVGSAEGLDALLNATRDRSWLVRYEGMIGLAKLINAGVVIDIGPVIAVGQSLEADDVQVVQNAASRIVKQLVMRREDVGETELIWALEIPGSLLFPLLLDAVKRPGFLAAYHTDVFRHEEMPRGPLTDVFL